MTTGIHRAHTGSAALRAGRPVDRLADGTPIYAPAGTMAVDGDRVCCHLCGRWFLSVASHVRVHGWTKGQYVQALGLELGNPLTGQATRERRSAALTARQAVEPALQRAQVRARVRSRSGALTAAAAAAARSRPHPSQRRAKTLAALAAVDPQARAEGSRRRAAWHRHQVAAAVADRFGFESFAAYLDDRLGTGMSMAAISREAGLHKDWVSRQLRAVAPQLAATRHEVRPHPGDVRLAPVARRLGYADVAAFLRCAHLEQHRTVAAIAAQIGVSRWTVLSAMRHHGITPMPHATKRQQAADRSRVVAGPLGFASLAAYVVQRRSRGMTWRDLAAECGIAESTLRRHGSSVADRVAVA